MKEIDGFTRGYVAGLADMMSDCSGISGPTSITAQCYSLDTFEAELTLELGIEGYEGLMACEPSEILLMELFSEAIGETYDALKAASSMLNRLRFDFGHEQSIMVPENPRLFCEAYSNYSGGRGPFYIVEQVFVIVFEDAAVMFVTGSDE